MTRRAAHRWISTFLLAGFTACNTNLPNELDFDPYDDINRLIEEVCFVAAGTASSWNTPVGFFRAQRHNYSGLEVVPGDAGSTAYIFGDRDGFKIVIILPAAATTGPDGERTYDLSTVYMSYTEKFGAGDLRPKVWKAVSGELVITPCVIEDVAATGFAWGARGRFSPLSETAANQFDMEFIARE